MPILNYIKEDWLYRLPNRLDNMKFRGLNRPAYTLICLIYYAVKSVVLLYLVVLYYAYKLVFLFLKFIFWDIWNRIFRIDESEWFQKLFSDEDDEEEYYEFETEYAGVEDTAEIEDEEDIPFCQLFKIGSDMCLLVDHVEMCPDEVAFIRVVDDEGYTPIYKRKVRRDKLGNRFIVFNSTNHYLDDSKTQPIISK